MEKKTILILCTGNTCRSPMCAGLLKKLLEEREVTAFEIRSAGVMTITGLLATPETIQIMNTVGVDLRRHRSKPLTEEVLKKADLVLGMTSFHTQSALRMCPEEREKITLLKEFTGSDPKRSHIQDPMGCTLEVYKRVFNDIRSCCNKIMRMTALLGVPLTSAEKKPRQKIDKPKKKAAKRKKAKKAAGKKTVKRTVKKTAKKSARKKATTKKKKK